MTLEQAKVLYNFQNKGYLLTQEGFYHPEVLVMGLCSLSYYDEKDQEKMSVGLIDDLSLLHFYDNDNEDENIPISEVEIANVKVWAPVELNL